MDLKCSSCGAVLFGQEKFVQFDCPKCGEEKIRRCNQCKTLSVPYVCKKCQFEGP